MLNMTIILGRLVRDPELRLSASGAAVGSFCLAVNHRFQDRNNQWQDECAFVPCTAFGKTAEGIQSRHKGDAMLAIGRLRTESWQKDGINHSRMVLVAEKVQSVQLSPLTKIQPNEPPPDSSVSGEVRKGVPF